MTKLDLLFRAIEQHTGFKKSELMTYTNYKEESLNEARYVAMTLAKLGLGFSFKKVGIIFKRDSKQIQYAVKKVRGNPETLVKAIIIQADITSQLNRMGVA